MDHYDNRPYLTLPVENYTHCRRVLQTRDHGSRFLEIRVDVQNQHTLLAALDVDLLAAITVDGAVVHVMTSVADWEYAREYATSDQMVYILVGNKCDLDHRREVGRWEAEALVNEHGIDRYLETSAKTGANVDALFTRHVAEEVYQRVCDGRIGIHEAGNGVRPGVQQSGLMPQDTTADDVAERACCA